MSLTVAVLHPTAPCTGPIPTIRNNFDIALYHGWPGPEISRGGHRAAGAGRPAAMGPRGRHGGKLLSPISLSLSPDDRIGENKPAALPMPGPFDQS